MRNIRTFKTYEDFLATQEAVSGSGQYVEDIVPGYAYIRDRYLAGEDGYTFFNKNNSSGETGGTEYIFGDLIYYDGNQELKSVYWSGWTETLGTPIGLVVIPTSMAPNGNARMIALADIESNASPIKGGEGDSGNLRSVDPSAKNNLYWQNYSGNEPDGNVYWYNGYSCNDPESNPVDYYLTTMSSNDQAAMSTDISGVTENPVADGEYYTSTYDNGYPAAVSPYMKEGDEINPNYLQESWEYTPPTLPMAQSPKSEKSETLLGSTNTNYSYNALSDFSGLTWTKLLAVNQEPYSAAQMYSTSGTNAGDWYVPSMGEAGFLQARYRAIVGILYSLFNESENYNAYPYEGIYCTSTLYNYNGYQTGVTPFVYYVNKEGLMSTQPKGETKLGTSYPSDVPVPLMGGYDLGLTYYNTNGGGIASVQPTKGVEEGNTILGSMYTAYVYVRPMAMIKDGHIVTEVGTPEANGHQINDLNEESSAY